MVDCPVLVWKGNIKIWSVIKGQIPTDLALVMVKLSLLKIIIEKLQFSALV